VHVFRVGGIGDSLMSTPALRLLKQIRPQVRIVFYTPFVQAFRGLPFLDEVRPLEDCSHPSAVWSLAKPRGVRYINILCGYRDGIVEFLYEGSLPPRRHIARIYGDQLGLDVGDVRPSCVFDEALIRQYQEAWAHLPRPWVVVNRKANNSPNKDWLGEHWDRLIARLLNRYTVIEIGAGRDGGDPVRHPHYVDTQEDSLSTASWPPSQRETSMLARTQGRFTSPPRLANLQSSYMGSIFTPTAWVIRETSTFTPRCPAPHAGY